MYGCYNCVVGGGDKRDGTGVDVMVVGAVFFLKGGLELLEGWNGDAGCC